MNNKVSKIDREALIKLESREKSKLDICKEYLLLFLPILALLLAVAEYLYIPNHSPDNKVTYNYMYLLFAFICIYVSFMIISIYKPKLRDRLLYKAPFYTFIGLFLLFYDYITLKLNILKMPFFPYVDRLLNSAWSDRELLLLSMFSSLKLLFTGYFIGAFVGLVTGVLCGYSKAVYYWVEPIIKLLGPIPTTTWLPLVMVAFSTLYGGSVFLIALGVWYSVTVSTITGISNVDRAYYDAAKTLGANDTQLILKIAIPSAIPNIFQGLTVGMSSACISLMVAEMLGVEAGLGWYVYWQKSWAEYGKMYAAIILLCISFIVVNLCLAKIKKRVLRWQEEHIN